MPSPALAACGSDEAADADSNSETTEATVSHQRMAASPSWSSCHSLGDMYHRRLLAAVLFAGAMLTAACDEGTASSRGDAHTDATPATINWEGIDTDALHINLETLTAPCAAFRYLSAAILTDHVDPASVDAAADILSEAVGSDVSTVTDGLLSTVVGGHIVWSEAIKLEQDGTYLPAKAALDDWAEANECGQVPLG